ncbi:MAG: hypothetical protein IMY74_11435 [Bacteroidetes bacterium]|nr:hypothetical protein [Bacteroidota bacterium]
MAITSATITKKDANQVMPGQYSVIWEFAGFDGAVELPVQTFSEDFKTGDSELRVISGFQKKIKTYIDKYNTEQALFASQGMDDAVTEVQTAIDGYLA